jgi:hypothetical protein
VAEVALRSGNNDKRRRGLEKGRNDVEVTRTSYFEKRQWEGR